MSFNNDRSQNGHQPIDLSVSSAVVRVASEHHINTGVVVDPRGLVLTSSGVVTNAAQVQLRFSDGQLAIAEVVHRDDTAHLALLRCRHMPEVSAVPRGNSSSLQVGDPVLFLGYTAEYSPGQGPESTCGRVTSLVQHEGQALIQMDVNVDAAGIGGPVLDSHGAAVGLVTSIDAAGCLALSVNDLDQILGDFFSDGNHSHQDNGQSSQTYGDAESENRHQRRHYSDARPRSLGRVERRPFQNAPGWYQALQATMQMEGFLVLATNESKAMTHRKFIDEQLAHIAVILARITARTTAGREPRVVQDEVGYFPSTFSTVGEFRRGGLINLVNGWVKEGMPTLLQFPVLPPLHETEQRSAILYANGPKQQISDLEQEFLSIFQPLYLAQSYGPESDDGRVHYCVQWELFPDEVATALGILPNAPELDHILDRLEDQGRQLRGVGPKSASGRKKASPNDTEGFRPQSNWSVPGFK